MYQLIHLCFDFTKEIVEPCKYSTTRTKYFNKSTACNSQPLKLNAHLFNIVGLYSQSCTHLLLMYIHYGLMTFSHTVSWSVFEVGMRGHHYHNMGVVIMDP